MRGRRYNDPLRTNPMRVLGAVERGRGLLDLYLTVRRQNDGMENFHLRGHGVAEAEELLPDWRQRRDEWRAK